MQGHTQTFSIANRIHRIPLPFFFFSLQTRTVLLNSTVEGRCYRHRCTSPNRYQVRVFGSGWVDCPAGGAIQVAARVGCFWGGSGAINTAPPALPPQVDGYHGAVFCPDGRLCLRSAPPPPSENASTFPASITRQVPPPLVFSQHHLLLTPVLLFQPSLLRWNRTLSRRHRRRTLRRCCCGRPGRRGLFPEVDLPRGQDPSSPRGSCRRVANLKTACWKASIVRTD